MSISITKAIKSVFSKNFSTIGLLKYLGSYYLLFIFVLFMMLAAHINQALGITMSYIYIIFLIFWSILISGIFAISQNQAMNINEDEEDTKILSFSIRSPKTYLIGFCKAVGSFTYIIISELLLFPIFLILMIIFVFCFNQTSINSQLTSAIIFFIVCFFLSILVLGLYTQFAFIKYAQTLKFNDFFNIRKINRMIKSSKNILPIYILKTVFLALIVTILHTSFFFIPVLENYFSIKLSSGTQNLLLAMMILNVIFFYPLYLLIQINLNAQYAKYAIENMDNTELEKEKEDDKYDNEIEDEEWIENPSDDSENNL